MNDRAVALFDQYDLSIEKTRKGRCAILADSSVGTVSLVPYNGPAEHLALQEALLQQMADRFDGSLDQIIRTTEGMLFCTDQDGKKYVVKHYVDGRECDAANAAECETAAKALARLHLSMRGVLLPEDVLPCYCADDPDADFKRRTAELARARSFIRKKSHKDDFELAFLRAYDCYIGQADDADCFLDAACMLALCEKQSAEKMFVHGDCTQHNIRIGSSGITFINFEKTGTHLQMKDVYLFMRKILEKNNWSFVLGQRILEAYTSVNPLEKPELRYLCARFLYPEKFWKIANGYLNRRKSLPARRMQEKLISFEEREQYRQAFLKQWLETCR